MKPRYDEHSGVLYLEPETRKDREIVRKIVRYARITGTIDGGGNIRVSASIKASPRIAK